MAPENEAGQDQTPEPTQESTPTFAEWQANQSGGAENSQQTTEPGTEAPNTQQGAQEAAQAQTPAPQPGGGHPAWDPIRQALGDEGFGKIQSHLAEFDRQAQQRITELNSKYDPWKAYETQGVTPDVVNRAIGIVRGIDENPLQMYQLLEQHLRSQGLLEQGQAQNADPDDPDGEIDPRDQELQALRDQQEQMVQFLQAQQAQAYEQELARNADQALEQEIQSLRTAHEGIKPEEEAAILTEYARRLKAGEFDSSLESIYAEREAYRTQILSQPRPNDLAPRIPGSGGTAPTAANFQQKDVSEYSRQESQALLADLIGRSVRGNS